MGGFELDLKADPHCAVIPLGPVEGQTDPSGGSSGLGAWISLKRAGDMGDSSHRDHPNRIRFLRSLGFRPDRPVYSCRQVHSKTLVEVTDLRSEEVL